MGFGWNRGTSSRVTSLIRSLWTICFLFFIILTIHAYRPQCQILPNVRGKRRYLRLVSSFLVNPVVRLLPLFGALDLRRDRADLNLLKV